MIVNQGRLGDKRSRSVCRRHCVARIAEQTASLLKARPEEDVDLIARTLTVRQQTCNGVTTTPKERTRRTSPMTSALYASLTRIATVREGFVVRNLDGAQKTDGEARWTIERICRKAGLPVCYWHTLRHSFGTHAALFSVNPWRLQGWMGHKRIEETMLYVHVATDHVREVPSLIREAAHGENDPDIRIVAMLGARLRVPFGTQSQVTRAKTEEVSAA